MEILLLLAAFLFLLFMGVPVAVAMLLSSIGNIIYMGIPPTIVAERLIAALNSFPLLAVPFFILAGVIMNKGGLTTRMVEVSRAFVGHFRGGTAQVNVLASIFFSGISGSASADAAGIGSMLIPTMKKEGYDPGFAAGITAASSAIGPIIPPSIIMVIYGSMTNLSIGMLFLAGVIPGLLIGVSLMVIVAILGRIHDYPRRPRVNFRAFVGAILYGLPALIAPVIILGGIVTGFYTATEAGVIACVYGLFIGMVVYRELRVADLPGLLAEALETTATPMFILASAALFGWLLTYHGLGDMIVDGLELLNLPPLALLFALVVMFLIIGLVIEGLAALMIFVPVLMPLVPAFGFDHLHFALIIIVTILIGTVTPPVGLQLYIAAAISRTSIDRVVVWPFVFAMLVVVALMVLFPELVTFLPRYLMG